MGTTRINVMQNMDLLIGCYPINGPMASGYIFFTSVRQVLGKKNITLGHRSIDMDNNLYGGPYPPHNYL